MKDLIRRIRDDLMATEDTVCLQRARLVTEAFQQHEGDPAPLVRAKAFAHVLRQMDLDVESNPIFAGNTSSRPRAWMLVPEHGMGVPDQVAIENEGLEGLLDGRIPEDLQAYWKDRSFGGTSGVGHLAVDQERVVHLGIEAMIAEAQRYGAEGDASQQVYRQAMAIALQAVIDWAHRYADAAGAAARSTPDPLRKQTARRATHPLFL